MERVDPKNITIYHNTWWYTVFVYTIGIYKKLADQLATTEKLLAAQRFVAKLCKMSSFFFF